eukprot:CAMPEP_0184308380 /NCGR_PEP_ID=MMETSP1049-20130417/16850_1 /TAXON_ID=77928 /ORGANISM="Proteomonas sulcata, Strain CCMP704" /LENGTH=463 /DNA_ID=CAMNT_0026621059 /DNA_START=124 /DNA_END=1515 /DNA_ORIENTATION=+
MSWLDLLSYVDSETSKVFYAVGMGAGYNLARLLDLWTPETSSVKVDLAKWGDAMKKANIGCNNCMTQICGACNECQHNSRQSRLDAFKSKHPDLMTQIESLRVQKPSTHAGPRLFGFEIDPAGLNVTKAVVKDLGLQNMMFIQNTAVGQRTKSAYAIKARNYDEDCAAVEKKACYHTIIGRSGLRGALPVQIETVDELRTKNNGKVHKDVIDILDIDVPDDSDIIARGAEASLKEHKIRLLRLRTNRRVSEHRIRRTARFAERYGYECYLAGPTALMRLTGCHSSRFYVRKMANTICVMKNDPWYKTLEKLEICSRAPQSCVKKPAYSSGAHSSWGPLGLGRSMGSFGRNRSSNNNRYDRSSPYRYTPKKPWPSGSGTKGGTVSESLAKYNDWKARVDQRRRRTGTAGGRSGSRWARPGTLLGRGQRAGFASGSKSTGGSSAGAAGPPAAGAGAPNVAQADQK